MLGLFAGDAGYYLAGDFCFGGEAGCDGDFAFAGVSALFSSTELLFSVVFAAYSAGCDAFFVTGFDFSALANDSYFLVVGLSYDSSSERSGDLDFFIGEGGLLDFYFSSYSDMSSDSKSSS